MRWIVCGLAVVSTLAFAASATVSGPGAARAETEAQLLRAHNLERDRVGVARLRWNPKLARQAQVKRPGFSGGGFI